MKITATLVKCKDLKCGELFSAVGPSYWGNRDINAIGEMVYIRLNGATPAYQANSNIYKITIEGDDESDLVSELTNENKRLREDNAKLSELFQKLTDACLEKPLSQQVGQSV